MGLTIVFDSRRRRDAEFYQKYERDKFIEREILCEGEGFRHAQKNIVCIRGARVAHLGEREIVYSVDRCLSHEKEQECLVHSIKEKCC